MSFPPSKISTGRSGVQRRGHNLQNRWLVCHDFQPPDLDGIHHQIDPYQRADRFQLQHGEVPVFGIANVLVREERTIKSYVGGYSGVSFRVASGVYYRLEGPLSYGRVTSLARCGLWRFPNDHAGNLLRLGQRKHYFRLPYSQIIRFQPIQTQWAFVGTGSGTNFAPQQGRTIEANSGYAGERLVPV